MNYLVYILFVIVSIGLVSVEHFCKNKYVRFAAFFSLLLLYFLLAILKGPTVGTDTKNYSLIYDAAKKDSFGSFISKHSPEYLFYSLVFIFSNTLNLSEIFFTVFCYLLICVLLFFALFKHNRRTMFLSMFLFIGFFCMSFSGIRQALAISLGTFALSIYFSKNIKLVYRVVFYFILVGIAFLFHQSAIVLLLVPMATLIDLELYQTPYIPLLLLLFFPLIMGRLAILVNSTVLVNEKIFDSRLSITFVAEVVFVLLLFLIYGTKLGKIVLKKAKIGELNFNDTDSMYMWLILLGCLFMCFNGASQVISRFAMFFYLGFAYFLVRVIDTFENKKIKFCYVAGITLLAGIYFVYSTPILELTPYVFR